jgi:hypothetical protein
LVIIGKLDLCLTTFSAYVLELRDRFRSYGPCYSDDVSWKSLALELEGENTRLREQLDAEKISK